MPYRDGRLSKMSAHGRDVVFSGQISIARLKISQTEILSLTCGHRESSTLWVTDQHQKSLLANKRVGSIGSPTLSDGGVLRV